MIDLVKLKVTAGNGGHGKIAFHREKYVPKGGPDGGKGGRGGNIIIRMNPHIGTLQHLVGVKSVVAENGAPGGSKQKFGADASDKVIDVPPGTAIWLVAENKISAKRRTRYGLNWLLKRSETPFQHYFIPKIGERPLQPYEPDEMTPVAEDVDPSNSSLKSLQQYDLPELIEITPQNPEVVIVQGGFGGRGNESFKSSSNTTPLEAEYGSPGEEKLIILELKLLADIGLVGFPNAGKSTLLSRLTHAKPKIANYPFTTLEPQLGIVSFPGGGDAVLADIPGVIEGAHEGKGLGFTFLKHLEHCEVLVMVLALEEAVVFDESVSDSEKMTILEAQLQAIQTELRSFNDSFLTKKHILIVNKTDIYNKALIDGIKKRLSPEYGEVLFTSAVTGEGLSELVSKMQEVVERGRTTTSE